MLEKHQKMSDFIFLADMHGLNIDCIEFDHLCDGKTIVYEIKIKKENGIEKRLNDFLSSCLLRDFYLQSKTINYDRFTIDFRFYEIKGGENESN